MYKLRKKKHTRMHIVGLVKQMNAYKLQRVLSISACKSIYAKADADTIAALCKYANTTTTTTTAAATATDKYCFFTTFATTRSEVAGCDIKRAYISVCGLLKD